MTAKVNIILIEKRFLVEMIREIKAEM